MVKEQIKNLLIQSKNTLEKGILKLSSLSSVMPNDFRKRTMSALFLVPLAFFFIYFSRNAFSMLVISCAVIMSYEWVTITRAAEGKEATLWKIFGFVYIVIPCTSLVVIRSLPNGADVILWFLATVWAIDIGAYMIGSTLKGPKLAPKISAGKTWSGLAGGVLAAVLMGFVTSVMFQGSAVFFMSFSAILAVIEQASDLMESKIKRIFVVKDSGNLIPGHGGLLDRLDGLTLTAPIVMLIVLMTKSIF